MSFACIPTLVFFPNLLTGKNVYMLEGCRMQVMRILSESNFVRKLVQKGFLGGGGFHAGGWFLRRGVVFTPGGGFHGITPPKGNITEQSSRIFFIGAH